MRPGGHAVRHDEVQLLSGVAPHLETEFGGLLHALHQFVKGAGLCVAAGE